MTVLFRVVLLVKLGYNNGMKFDTERRYYVYAWYVKDTSEVFYIGKGTRNRYKNRKRENRFFTHMVNKHDCDSLILKDGLTEQEAFDLEKVMIEHYRTENTRLTNVQDGGEQPPVHYGTRPEWWVSKMRDGIIKYNAEHPEKAADSSRRMKRFLRTKEGKAFMEKSIKSRQTQEFREECSKRVQRFCRSDEYRKKLSDATKAYYAKHGTGRFDGANNHNAQAIQQYDKDGNFIKEYSTITEASKATGTCLSKITAVAKGKRKTAGGFVWKYSSDKGISFNHKNIVYKKQGCKPIVQYDLSGNVVAEYASIAEASKENNLERTNIIACLKGRIKTAYGYKWSYK